MKLGLVFFAATVAQTDAFVAKRNARTHRLAKQLHTVVPNVKFGNIDAHLAKTMNMLAPLSNEELMIMKHELDAFYESILSYPY